VFGSPAQQAPILRWWAVTVDPPPWQELRALRQQHAPWMTKAAWDRRYGYLSPQRFPDSVQEARQPLQSSQRDSDHPALTIRERWLASDDSTTRTVAAPMLRMWPGKGSTPRAPAHRWLPVLAILAAVGDATGETGRWTQVVAEIVSTHRSDTEVRAVPDRVGAAILLPNRVPDRDRARWVTTLWALVADSTRSDKRRQMIAAILHRMTHDPTVTAMIRDLLRVEPSLPTRVVHERVWHTLRTGRIQTDAADGVLDIIERVMCQNRDAVIWLAHSIAEGWGNGHDRSTSSHRIPARCGMQCSPRASPPRWTRGSVPVSQG